jgi:hypothetical protein
MAYISQDDKRELAPNIKAVLDKHNVKGTISIRNHATLVVNIQEGALNFFTPNNLRPFVVPLGFTGQGRRENYSNVNQYHYHKYYKNQPECIAFFDALFKAMKGTKWYDKSDAMYDHFDTAYYLSVNVGKWNNHYKYTPNKTQPKKKVSYLMEGRSKTIDLMEGVS